MIKDNGLNGSKLVKEKVGQMNVLQGGYYSHQALVVRPCEVSTVMDDQDDESKLEYVEGEKDFGYRIRQDMGLCSVATWHLIRFDLPWVR
jgi:hypothetical protein